MYIEPLESFSNLLRALVSSSGKPSATLLLSYMNFPLMRLW